jgi:hypothetical protein
VSGCTHCVLHSIGRICWECRHNPCAGSPPLVWDEAEQAYYQFFLSCHGKMKKNIWLSKPTSNLARICFQTRRKETKRQQEKRKEGGRVCPQSTDCREQRVMLPPPCKEIKRERPRRKKLHEMSKSRQPDHCIHCNEDPCLFVQIELCLCENNGILHDSYEYENAPVVEQNLFVQF